MKFCPQCKNSYELLLFHFRIKKGTYSKRCKICHNKNMKLNARKRKSKLLKTLLKDFLL